MDKKNAFPLTLAQFDIYIHQSLFPSIPFYNIGGYIKCGSVDVERIKSAHKKLIMSHDAFGLRILSSSSDIHQFVSSERNTELPVIDFSEQPEPESAALEWIQKTNETSLELEGTELFRAYLIKTGPQSYWYFLLSHHLIMDGLSIAIVCKKLAQYYDNPHFVESEMLDWSDISLQDIQYKENARYLKDKEFWSKFCSNRAEPMLQPIYRQNFSESKIVPSRRQTLKLQRSLVDKLENLSRELNVGLSQIFLSVISIYYSIAHQRKQLFFGVPSHNRRNFAQKKMIGLFTNVNPLQLDINQEISVREYVTYLTRLQKSCYRYQRFPSGELVREFGDIQMNTSFYDVVFNYSKQTHDCVFNGVDSEINYLAHNYEQVPVSFFVWDNNSGEVDIHVDYNLAYYQDQEITFIIKRLDSLFNHFIFNQDRCIGELKIIPECESGFLDQVLNAQLAPYQGPSQLHEQFEYAVNLHANQIALICEDSQLTYAQLDEAANAFAHELISQGVREQMLVGLCFERSAELMVAILAVLKVGGAYVPLDPAFPQARLDFMLADAALSFVVTQVKLVDLFKLNNAVRIISLDNNYQGLIAKYPASKPICSQKLKASDPAYVIYTSGSTGQPKGVLVEHGAITEHIFAVVEQYAFNKEDKVLQVANYAFDTFIEQTFAALFTGASLVIAGKKVLDCSTFFDLVEQNQITITDLTPAHFHQFLSRDTSENWKNSSISRLIIGGEPVSCKIIRDWFEYGNPNGCNLYNAYGPTEAVITSVLKRITPEDQNRICIGKVFANRQLKILNKDMTPTPVGLAGELYIGGPLLARGYLNQKELTRQKFITGSIDKETRFYRTGDMVRLLPDGNLEFIARVDEQIKINGFRVELKEIENQLMASRQLNSCLVIPETDNNGLVSLIAYVIANSDADNDELTEVLIAHLALQLPRYMLPREIVLLEDWPLTPNGKVDKKALSQFKAVKKEKNTADHLKSQLEEELSQIICRVIGADSFGIYDNFFEAGVNSLLLLRIQRAVNEETRFRIHATDLFAHSSIAKLAKFLNSDDEQRPDAVPEKLAKDRSGDIAIISMACRFPDAEDASQFWHNVASGKESIQYFSDQQLLEAGASQADIGRKAFIKSGVILENIEFFDTEVFGFSPREAEILDPQQRLLFECVNDSLEQAGCGYKKEAQNIGVFVGVGNSRYLFENLLSHPQLLETVGDISTELGTSKDFVATKISYEFNLTGPSVNINTACSTSLVSVHQACMSLLDGSCDLALAGGASVGLLKPEGYIAEEGGIASLDGHCRAFDAHANGTRLGSGAGVVLLKPLEQAIIDGDVIHAVIKGSAINNDAADKVGFTAPSVQGQSQVIKSALRSAGVAPETLGYVETHGTGTVLGDPIEIAALKQAFGATERDQYCALGTLKPNIGHLDSAAGIAGLIKTVEVLKARQLPPCINFQHDNHHIDFANSPFYVNTSLKPWPEQAHPRRAGVSAFGIGGTNAHVVLEEYLSKPVSNKADTTQLITLSAKTQTSLSGYKQKLAKYLNENSGLAIEEVACNLAKRTEHNYRSFYVCNSSLQLAQLLKAEENRFVDVTFAGTDEPPKPVFLFPGQGVQYHKMGQGLFDSFPVFREALQRCSTILQPLIGLDICQVLFCSQEEEIKQTHITQPLLFSFEYALAQLWLSWGVKPSVMLGHSLGEYVAACLSGVFTLEEALKIVALRGRLMQALEKGAMMSVPLSERALTPYLQPGGACLAAVNGRDNCVVSGTLESITALKRDLDERGIHGVVLDTSHAFHSEMMSGILNEFAGLMHSIDYSYPQLPFISNLTGDLISPEQAMNPDYWCQHLRHTVQFARGTDTLIKMGQSVFLELGPGKTLIHLIKRHRPELDLCAVSSVRDRKYITDDSEYILSALGKLWRLGVAVDWSSYYPGKSCQGRAPKQVMLPGYHYDRKRYWIEKASADTKEHRATSSIDKGHEGMSPGSLYQLVWKASPLAKTRHYSFGGRHKSHEHGACALLFMDETGFSEALKESLENDGYNEIIRVYPGECYAQNDACTFTLAPDDKNGYLLMVTALKQRNIAPDLIIHAWSLTPVNEQCGQFNEREIEYGLYSLLYLLQAIEHPQKQIVLKILTSHAQFFDQDDVIHPGKSCLSALPAVISQEFPHINCQCVDLEIENSHYLSKQVHNLTEEIFNCSEDKTICFRGSHRWYQSIVPLEEESCASLLQNKGVYAVSGGLGGIGLALAEYLAEQTQAKIILIARSGFPRESDWNRWLEVHGSDNDVSEKILKLRNIQKKGSELLICQADMSAQEDIEAVLLQINQRFGQLNGFIHAAGIAGSGLIAHKSAADIKRVLSPKVNGSVMLAQALKKYCPDFVVFCSSLSSLYGGLGQFEYSAANAFQDALAFRETSLDTRYISINWDSWGESGMFKNSVDAGLLPGVTDEYLSATLSNHEGAAAFGRVLSLPNTQILVSKFNLEKAIPLNGLDEHLQPKSTGYERPELASDYVEPISDIEVALAGIWSDLLGIEKIGIEDDFYALGGDSLVLGRVVSKINQLWSIRYPVQSVFEQSTISDLALGIEQHLSIVNEGNSIDLEYEEEVL